MPGSSWLGGMAFEGDPHASIVRRLAAQRIPWPFVRLTLDAAGADFDRASRFLPRMMSALSFSWHEVERIDRVQGVAFGGIGVRFRVSEEFASGRRAAYARFLTPHAPFRPLFICWSRADCDDICALVPQDLLAGGWTRLAEPL